MRYVGIATWQRRNNMMSMLLLVLFPVIMLCMVWLFIAIVNYLGNTSYNGYGEATHYMDSHTVNNIFVTIAPWVIGAVAVWFLISYFSNTAMIRKATGAQPLERRDNPRVYNIVENLTMACGMDMPKINIIDDQQLNAFASGIDKKSYTVTLTTGIINCLDDEELAGVIGHELTHIRNHDTRLLITSIIFVGIVATLTSLVMRLFQYNMFFGGLRNNNKNSGCVSTMFIFIIAIVICFIGYFFTILTRFAISRRREYMADAGGAELCGNPRALAGALRKISDNTGLGDIGRDDIAQLFIIHPQNLQTEGISNFINSLFSTHPSTESRIAILEQF